MPLRYPAASFLPNLASDYMKIYPKHVAENLTQDQANKGIGQEAAMAAIEAGQPEGLIGSGPWMLREWEKDTGYSFDRNPNYFKTGRPFFEGLKIYLIVDVARNLSALQTGQVYGTYQSVTTHTPENAARLEQDTDGRVRALGNRRQENNGLGKIGVSGQISSVLYSKFAGKSGRRWPGFGGGW